MIYCIHLLILHTSAKGSHHVYTLNSSIFFPYFLFVTKHERNQEKKNCCFVFVFCSTYVYVGRQETSSAVSTFWKESICCCCFMVGRALNKKKKNNTITKSHLFLYEIESVAECFCFMRIELKYSVSWGYVYERLLGWRYLGPTAGHLSSDRCAYLQDEKCFGSKPRRRKGRHAQQNIQMYVHIHI